MTDAPTPPTDLLSYVPLFLPSNGFPYKGLVPEGKVEARRMLVGEINAFSTHGGTPNDKIDRLLKTCVKLPKDVLFGQLLSADRMALLIALRKLSVGTLYKMSYKCKYCGGVNHTECDLTRDFEVKSWTEESECQETWDVTLPECRHTVAVRLLTGKDEDQLAKYAGRYQRDKGEDKSLPYRLALHIVSINGKAPAVFDRQDYAEKLTLNDLGAIQDKIEEVEPGFQPDIDLTCGKCSSEQTITWRMDDEFFRPRVR